TLPAQLRVLATAPSSEAGSHPDMVEPYARMSIGQIKRAQAADVVHWIELTIHEGKFHQVKRMFEAVGSGVVYLQRVSMGPLLLDPALPFGAWRELTDEEIDGIRSYRAVEKH